MYIQTELYPDELFLVISNYFLQVLLDFTFIFPLWVLDTTSSQEFSEIRISGKGLHHTVYLEK